MKRALTSVAVLLLACSGGALAGSSEQTPEDNSSNAVGGSTLESNAPNARHADKESSERQRRSADEQDELGTMGTGNTGTTGGMGATTGTDTIGGTVEE
ncbi:hypothetical protein C6Y58_01965 [Stutzerimonas stutzeri]|nr:hypothetical protein C6Y58_01965 [Stutzerimonas stutzeri]